MGDDPPFSARKPEKIFLAGKDRVIIPGRLRLVRKEPLELKPTARTAVPLALSDNDPSPALWTGEADGREALFIGFSLHAPSFVSREGILLPEGGSTRLANLTSGRIVTSIIPRVVSEEANMDRELEFLRQQCEYLERMLQNCLSHISSLEARVAELERRPVAISIPDEPRAGASSSRRSEADLLMGHGITFRESPRGRRR